ncbi:GDP-mannose 4,6-dehydratase [Thiohalobacter sp. IOR34]|uniref:GDP-mannose 4,6-dehydratase n=1 Tax=Thiohalobacter sp. IOR34 TaxID=3057176 RepID=UPI0025B19919|nr:GDP-mannose 4,6-dehydratase [Thiohalobacter sp. IOR34]WJW76307.1 GDP-mannose 4,6-dehydratase [Thiohalobacter sp. IOR34]
MGGFWNNRNVFVTGCTGFLGSWLSQELIHRGAHVVGLVRDWVPESHLFQNGGGDRVTLVRGSLEDLPVIERAINEYEIDTVFHLAAQAIVGVANQSPVATFEANIMGTWNVLEACRRISSVKRIVMASSDKAYGDQKTLPYTEEFPLQGRHPYDVSKSCADLIAATYHHSYQLPVCVTRCGNLFGGGDLNFNRIIPGTIRMALNDERPVIRSDGTPLRDYIYVKDAVDAYLLLAEKMIGNSVQGEAFNFGTAKPMSVLEITNKVLELMGRSDLAPLVLNEAKGEILHQYLSSDKARRLLGWEPVSSLDDGLRATIDWYRNFLSANH